MMGVYELKEEKSCEAKTADQTHLLCHQFIARRVSGTRSSQSKFHWGGASEVSTLGEEL